MKSDAWTDIPTDLRNIPSDIKGILHLLIWLDDCGDNCERCAEGWERFNRLPGLNFFLWEGDCSRRGSVQFSGCGKCYSLTCSGGCG
jgi:hypothetical protein